MERIICNHCEKEIKEFETPWHIEARHDVNTFIDDRDSFNLCDDCYKKVFKVKVEE